MTKNYLFALLNNLFQSAITTTTPAINADAISWMRNSFEVGTIPYEPNKTSVLCGIATDPKIKQYTAAKSKSFYNLIIPRYNNNMGE